MAKYAISVSAGKSIDGRIRLSVGSGVGEAPNDAEANSAAMEYAVTVLKPSDGYSGHTVSVMEIPEQEAPKKHWFKFG